jgi:prepilin-type N-terminal cleavage/methylation domain-containing protein/prepilin-type processing-associated H-X9-DG protein
MSPRLPRMGFTLVELLVVIAIIAILGDAVQVARSYHSGGVNVLFADGSGHFIGNGVDIATWRALGTIAGGEVPGDW